MLSQTPKFIIWSAIKKKAAAKAAINNTITVEIDVSRRVGQVTFAVSARTCFKKVMGLVLEAIIHPIGFRCKYESQSQK